MIFAIFSMIMKLRELFLIQGEKYPFRHVQSLIPRQADDGHATLTEGGADGGNGIERGYRHVKYLPLLFWDYSSSEVTSAVSSGAS